MGLISDSTTKPIDEQKAAELSDDLHQAAQPLTVLQGCLELALSGPHTGDEYQRSIRRALDESRRVSACFERIRALVQRTSADVAASTEPPKSAITHAEGIRCVHV